MFFCKAIKDGVNSAIHTSRKSGSGKPVEKGNLKEESTPYNGAFPSRTFPFYFYKV